MKKIYFTYGILFLLNSISFPILAQGWDWRIHLSNPSKIVKDNTNNIYTYWGDMSGTTITKYSISGSVLWTKMISGNVQVTAVKIDLSNNLIVLGNFTAPVTVDTVTVTPHGSTSFFILKIASSSAVMSMNVYGCHSSALANALYITGSGDYLIAGNFNDTLKINSTVIIGDTLTNGFLLRTDASQNVIWSQQATLYTHSGNASVDMIGETASGHMYAEISMAGGLVDFNGYQFTASSGQFLCYMDAARNISSSTFLTYFGFDYSYPEDLHEISENGYLKNVGGHYTFSGKMERYDAAGTNTYLDWATGGIGYDTYAGKIYYAYIGYDNASVPSTYTRKIGTLGSDLSTTGQFVDSLLLSSDGSYSGMQVIDANNYYIEGNETSFGEFIGKYSRMTTGYAEHPIEKDDFGVYPNPASQQLYLKGIRHNNEKVKIYSSLGLLVYSGINSGESIDVSGLLPSVYFIEICGNSDRRTCFIKE